MLADIKDSTDAEWPSVTIVFLVYNRRDELRESLRRMLYESDYDRERVDVIVVDNASTDGSAAMVREEFPHVRLITRDRNAGISAINAGFAQARGDYVLALDDDCYLPPDGLRRAVAAAAEHRADLVSFKVVSTHDPGWVFEKHSRGLLVFVGCAFLARREVLEALGGFDPELFIWANELEFMLRFFDRGFRHLHLPDVVALHMKPPGQGKAVDYRAYRINARHWAYIAGKLLRPRDAVGALVALMATEIRDGLRNDAAALAALPDTVLGFLHGLRLRDAVHSVELSRCYRRNYVTFASPWWVSRPVGELIRAMPREILRGGLADTNPANVGRRNSYLADRARFYPNEPATLEF
jgi:GT2 family glycosyltransferase